MIACSNKASTGPMRTLSTTRQLRRGQSGVCRPSLKTAAAQNIVYHFVAAASFSLKQIRSPKKLASPPRQLSAAFRTELQLAAKRVQQAHCERRRRDAQFKLQQARLQLISQDRRLAALPLNQHQVARTYVPMPEVVTPVAFRKQFTFKPSSLSQSTCTCTATAPATYQSSSSWSDDEDDMDCDFDVPAEWGLTDAQLAQFGLSAASACTCSEEDFSFVHLASLRRSLPQSALDRVALASQRWAHQQGRNHTLAFVFDTAVRRARALGLEP